MGSLKMIFINYSLDSDNDTLIAHLFQYCIWVWGRWLVHRVKLKRYEFYQLVDTLLGYNWILKYRSLFLRFEDYVVINWGARLSKQDEKRTSLKSDLTTLTSHPEHNILENRKGNDNSKAGFILSFYWFHSLIWNEILLSSYLVLKRKKKYLEMLYLSSVILGNTVLVLNGLLLKKVSKAGCSCIAWDCLALIMFGK